MSNPNPIHVIPVQGVGGEVLDAVKAYTDAVARRQELEARQQMLEMQKDELALRKSAFQQSQEELAAQHQKEAEEATLLQTLAASIAGQPKGAAGPTAPGIAPMGAGLPGAAPGQQAGPTLPGPGVASILAGYPHPEAIAGALKAAGIDLGQMIRDETTQAQNDAKFEEVLASIKDPKQRQDFRILTLAHDRNPAIPIPATVAMDLAPSLFPKTVNPDTRLKIIEAMQNYGWDLGRARTFYGEGPIAGMPDSTVVPGKRTPMSQTQAAALSSLILMEHADKKMGENPPLSWSGQRYRELERLATSGGITGLVMGGIKTIVDQNLATGGRFAKGGPLSLTGDQGATLNQLNFSKEFTAAAILAISGRQATDAENARLLSMITPLSQDSPGLQAAKAQMRAALRAGAHAVASGEASSGDVLNQLIEQARGMPFAKTGDAAEAQDRAVQTLRGFVPGNPSSDSILAPVPPIQSNFPAQPFTVPRINIPSQSPFASEPGLAPMLKKRP